MKLVTASTITLFGKSIFIIFLAAFISCTPKNDTQKPINSIDDEVEDEGIEYLSDQPEPDYSENSSLPILSKEKKDFKVVLSVDSVMYLKQSGMMQIWIGEEDIDVAFSKGMNQDIKRISSSIGRFAKISPYAPDFDIKALSTTICYKIDPSGSEVRYSLTPKDEGEYKVSADIELFDTQDCTGISVPKTAKALSVSVKVNMNKEISKKVHEMEKVVWDKFKIFWIALITLLFGAAIFVARRFIKKKTGYEDESK